MGLIFPMPATIGGQKVMVITIRITGTTRGFKHSTDRPFPTRQILA